MVSHSSYITLYMTATSVDMVPRDVVLSHTSYLVVHVTM